MQVNTKSRLMFCQRFIPGIKHLCVKKRLFFDIIQASPLKSFWFDAQRLPTLIVCLDLRVKFEVLGLRFSVQFSFFDCFPQSGWSLRSNVGRTSILIFPIDLRVHFEVLGVGACLKIFCFRVHTQRGLASEVKRWQNINLDFPLDLRVQFEVLGVGVSRIRCLAATQYRVCQSCVRLKLE